MQKYEIDSHEALEEAIARLDRLDNEGPRSEDAEEYQLLLEAIEEFEEKHIEIPPPSPVEAIRFRMEQGNLRQKDLIPYLGTKSRVSEVLSGQRPLSKTMILNLHKGLGIPLASLMGVRGPAFGQEEMFGILAKQIVKTICELWVSNMKPVVPAATAGERGQIKNSSGTVLLTKTISQNLAA